MTRTRKIAVVGTSCAGKTTLVHAAAAVLARQGVLVETVTSSDRRHPFTPTILDTILDAQAYLLFNQLLLEADRASRPSTELILCDRSVIDLWLMAELRTLIDPHHDHIKAATLRSLAYGWALTYDALLYAPPLPFHDDHARLPDDERLRIEPDLRHAIMALPNAILLPEPPDDRLEVVLRVAA